MTGLTKFNLDEQNGLQSTKRSCDRQNGFWLLWQKASEQKVEIQRPYRCERMNNLRALDWGSETITTDNEIIDF